MSSRQLLHVGSRLTRRFLFTLCADRVTSFSAKSRKEVYFEVGSVLFLRHCSALLTPDDVEIIDTDDDGYFAISVIRKIFHTHLLTY